MLDEFDEESFVNKGLYEDGELTERYYTLVKNYKVLLDNYLLNKLGLSEVDYKIINSGLSFVPIDIDDMDFYQKFSSMGLKYLYLRNNIYINKLSLDDMEKIENLSVNQMQKPSSKLMTLIEDTFKDVIDAKPYDADQNVDYMKCYGLDSDEYWVKSNELVIGVRYDEFADNGLGEGDDWFDNYNKQLEFLGKLMLDLEKSCSEVLNMKVNLLYYDEASVMRSMGNSK